MTSNKILLIEDDLMNIELFRKYCRMIGIDYDIFLPRTHDESGLKEELKEVLLLGKPTLVLLDYNLWGPITGDMLAPVVHQAGIPFVGCSGQEYNNNELIKLGAYGAVGKEVFESADVFQQKVSQVLRALQSGKS